MTRRPAPPPPPEPGPKANAVLPLLLYLEKVRPSFPSPQPWGRILFRPGVLWGLPSGRVCPASCWDSPCSPKLLLSQLQRGGPSLQGAQDEGLRAPGTRRPVGKLHVLQDVADPAKQPQPLQCQDQAHLQATPWLPGPGGRVSLRGEEEARWEVGKSLGCVAHVQGRSQLLRPRDREAREPGLRPDSP